jgi:hypothetical protein
MSTVSIVPVSGKSGLKDFLHVPFTVYKDDPNWVAPLFLERQDHLNPKKNPFFEHAEAQLFVAYRSGKPVGRISAQDDRLRLQHQPDNCGMFGFFDCIDEKDVANELIHAAEDWLKGRGRSGMLGPFCFSINDEMGLLIDGFDTPPSMMMPHGRPHMRALLEGAGLTKAKDVIAYHYEFGGQSTLMKRVKARALSSGDFTLRPLNTKDFQSEVRVLMSIFNDAWSGNWGFVPFTEAESSKLATDMKMLIGPGFGAVASYKGEPAAFVVTLPNLNEYIKGMNGRILPFNWIRLAMNVLRKRPQTFRMPLMGVRRKFHGTSVGSTLAALVIEEVKEYQLSRGGTSAELSWILEDNLPVRKIIETFNATPYKTYRIFKKDF